MAADVQVYYNL